MEEGEGLRFWSEKEVELLRELWVNPKVSKADLIRVFKRSWDSLDNKAHCLELGSFYSHRGLGVDVEFLGELRKRIKLKDRELK